ncbi:MAG: hypothetical protein V4596_06675 [Bdellovibrionota bacterium]
MTKFLLLLPTLLLLSVPYSHAEEEKDGEVKQYVICRNQKVVRTIRVECVGSECDTIYTKDGADKIEGSNNNVMGGQKILGNIQANLEKAAWKCNDVTANAKIAD